MSVAIVLLAAGASTRMRGGDKLLEMIDGTPLILQQLRRCCAVSGDVTLALPKGDRKRRAWVTDSPARVIEVADQAMSASIRAGVTGCRADALMIVLADMPEVTVADMEAMVAAHLEAPDRIIQATSGDRGGLPVVFPKRLFDALCALQGDRGAKALVRAEQAVPCPLPQAHALTDLDTPEDWAAWRAANEG